MFGQPRGVVNGAGPADIMFQIMAERFPKFRIVFRCLIGIRQLLQSRNQGLGHEQPAVLTEKDILVGRVVVLHQISSLCFKFSDGNL